MSCDHLIRTIQIVGWPDRGFVRSWGRPDQPCVLWEVIANSRAVCAVFQAGPPIIQEQMVQMQYWKAGRPSRDRTVSSMVERVGVGGKGVLN